MCAGVSPRARLRFVCTGQRLTQAMEATRRAVAMKQTTKRAHVMCGLLGWWAQDCVRHISSPPPPATCPMDTGGKAVGA
jgi:hypothetical protein